MLPEQGESRFAIYPSLRGKGVLVTGGATGIGRAIVVAFSDQGAQVVFLDRDRDAGEALAHDLGSPHSFTECDVTDTPALQEAVDEAARVLGRLDIVITNAADDSRHEAATLSVDEWETALAVNLGHQFFTAQAAQPHLRAAGGGSIVFLGSIAWLNNTTGMVAYTTAKAGVHGLVRTLARLWGREGIRVNALLPGWTMTERQRALWVDDDVERLIDASQCLPGRVVPEDIARAALFLASDDAAMITHQAFIVDAGWI